MNEYRSLKDGANRDFREQFKSVNEYRATMSQTPKVPSLIPHRSDTKKNQGFNRAPAYSKNPVNPRRSRLGYNIGN